MNTKTTSHKPLTLVCGGKYLTREGKEVTLLTSAEDGFRDSDGWLHHPDGTLFSQKQSNFDIISEVPKITLEHGKTYVTTAGERVTMTTREADVYGFEYVFTGSNKFAYRSSGDFDPAWNSVYKEHIIVSEHKELESQPRLYTGAELLAAMSDSYNNGKAYGRIFSTSELQSLTKMQSKAITALEAEILELKVTAQYLGNCVGLVNRVNGLRKQIFNEITIKKKRLVKLVALQSKLKRTK